MKKILIIGFTNTMLTCLDPKLMLTEKQTDCKNTAKVKGVYLDSELPVETIPEKNKHPFEKFIGGKNKNKWTNR